MNMNATEQPEEPFDWEQWPAHRAEMISALEAMRQHIAQLDRNPNLDNVRPTSDKLMRDTQNVIAAGDAEYGRLHPSVSFDSN